MSQTFAQIVPAKSLQPADVASATFASAPQFSQTRDKVRPVFRLDLRRSLHVHRRLALSLALIGLALAVIYLLNSWSIRSAQSANGFQPVAGSHTNGTLHEHQLASGAIPGIAKFAAVAVTPWYFGDSSVIRNAIALLLSFIFLGAAVAVIAHKVDPRIYVASDVEHLLGFAPMVQLPDFSEVANEVFEEHLLRLASGIDRAFKDRSISHCVFTGAGPGVGVTTVATRVKELLEKPGNAAVITDAAPLTDSEDTEQLVRSADGTIVVIEAGVTTRAQLRAVASTLQRLKAPAVGFVLNRVQLATADPAFRRSIKEMSRHLTRQGPSTDAQMLQTLQQAIEEGSASLDLDPGAQIQLAANPSAEIVMGAAPTGKVVQPEPALPVAFQQPDLLPNSVPEPVKRIHEEIPSPWAQMASQFDAALPLPETERCQNPQTARNRGSGSAHGQEPAKSVPRQTTHLTLPRLSELRGMCFSQALRELDQTRRPAQPSAGVETLMSAIAPFETLFTQMDSAQNGVLSGAGHVEPEPLAAMHASIPLPESGVEPEAENGTAANENGAKKHPSQPNFLPSKPVGPAKAGGHRGENHGGTRPVQNAAVQMSGGILDQLQILPSRRGQYKKKS